ncbi:Por secretion system C-terminal sorting domain-containing protein [Flavobacteriaceae bacterium MAR_2010_188]|nr:Por secretion system C-terminal sorting domain-containing protein [Flavobacteriaceae bacterium MAR_2010_188]
MKFFKLLFKINKSLFIFLASSSTLFSQNTVGTISYSATTQSGYTLFTSYKDTYLINNCGEVVNKWTSDYSPGNSVYLLPTGEILRAGNTQSETFQFGGSGGVIERFNWDGTLNWQFFYDNEEHRQHHDIYPMPNGNVLILAATEITRDEAIAAGRNPALIDEDQIYNERIIEVQPSGLNRGTIVWEWNFFDHLIQDFDSTKNNFGNVSLHPERLDFNYTQNNSGSARWLHINSLQYDENLDQVVLSSRFLNEIYIIDHSTSTSEAATSTGGDYSKGGDFLYRWGNPQVYRQGTEADRQLGGQHYAHFIEQGLRDAGKLMLYNNQYPEKPANSAIFILDLPESSPGNYSYTANTEFGPTSPDYIYAPDDLYSPIVSSAQRLENGNTLIAEGSYGELREIDENENIVWQYIVPENYTNGNIISQGYDPSLINNMIFRALKYSETYPAFQGRDLTPSDPIELNPNISSCVTLSTESSELAGISIFPNPTDGLLNINSFQKIDEISITDLTGKTINISTDLKSLDISNLQAGIYLLQLQIGGNTVIKKIIKR